jgi:hypothetical protein
VIRGESEFESSFLIVHADLTLIDIIEVFWSLLVRDVSVSSNGSEERCDRLDYLIFMITYYFDLVKVAWCNRVMIYLVLVSMHNKYVLCSVICYPWLLDVTWLLFFNLPIDLVNIEVDDNKITRQFHNHVGYSHAKLSSCPLYVIFYLIIIYSLSREAYFVKSLGNLKLKTKDLTEVTVRNSLFF